MTRKIPPGESGQPSLLLTYDRHPLAYVVEVEDGQELVDHFSAHLHHHDALRCPRAEHEAEVARGGDQSALVWGLGLIVELPCGDQDLTHSVWKSEGEEGA